MKRNEDAPYLGIRASISKNLKATTLPLHPWLVSLLAAWRAKNPTLGTSRPIVKVPTSMLSVLNRDLRFAGIPKTDSDGKVVHLHAARHSFITMLARMGVQPHVVQKLARHAKMEMTMGVYTHVVHGDESSAIKSLPVPQAGIAEKQATGTDDSTLSSGPHVQPHVQNSDSDRVVLSSAGDLGSNTAGMGNANQRPGSKTGVLG